jgi:hypothetical protein
VVEYIVELLQCLDTLRTTLHILRQSNTPAVAGWIFNDEQNRLNRRDTP